MESMALRLRFAAVPATVLLLACLLFPILIPLPTVSGSTTVGDSTVGPGTPIPTAEQTTPTSAPSSSSNSPNSSNKVLVVGGEDDQSTPTSTAANSSASNTHNKVLMVSGNLERYQLLSGGGQVSPLGAKFSAEEVFRIGDGNPSTTLFRLVGQATCLDKKGRGGGMMPVRDTVRMVSLPTCLYIDCVSSHPPVNA
jgi:hypothetical protein